MLISWHLLVLLVSMFLLLRPVASAPPSLFQASVMAWWQRVNLDSFIAFLLFVKGQERQLRSFRVLLREV